MKGILLAIQSSYFARVRRSNRAMSCVLGALLVGICGLCSGSASAQSVYGPPVPPAITSTLPTVRVTLSRPAYRITIDPKTGVPQMPKDIFAAATAVNWPGSVPPPTEFAWHAYLRWDYKPYPTCHRIEKETFLQASPLKIDLGNEIRGGTLTVYVKAMLDGKEVLGRAQAQVLADNPTRSMVLHAFPPNRTGLIASKIGMAESGLHQFTEARGVDSGGQPYVSPSNDIGLMQLNAPSGGVSSPDEVWDWQANIRRGLAMLAGKRQTTLASRSSSGSLRMRAPVYTFEGQAALATANMCRVMCGLGWLPLPEAPAISDAPGSGLLLGELDPDHLNLTQREREAIRRYNGGSEYACDLCLDDTGFNVRVVGWVPDPTRGGVDPRRGDPSYVNHVLLARSGFTLPAPPSPKKPVRQRRSRKRQA
ncbi:MAG: hypothetical protein JWN14_2204 [Chthonomonadales bacterium]|nr:hypothetical protein [Chthonomonadales bacterium]